jgi:RecG-like helicase
VSKLYFRPGVLARRRRLRPAQPSAAALEAPPVITLIADLRARSRVTVQGMIRSAGTVRVASGVAYHFTLVDGSGELDVLFLGQSDMAGLQPSTRILAEGTVGSYDSKLALWNPRYTIAPARPGPASAEHFARTLRASAGPPER